MFKFLKDVVVGSGGVLKDLPYNIGDPYSICWGSWKHYRGTSKEDSSPVSIFVFQATNAQDGRLTAARNGVKRLRTVRHPNVLAYLHSTEVEVTEGGQIKPTIYMVTEPVMPLEEKLKQLNLQGSQRDEYYAWGLHQISKAVSFLNNDCKLVHGNVCATSVVVTPSLDWKLYAFDVLSEFDGSNSDANGPMLPHEWLVGTQYKPLELAKGVWATIRKSPPWALDSWGLGCLIYELFAGMKLLKTEELQNTSSIPKSLLSDYQRLLNSTPSRRLNSSKLIENSEYFHNKLVETIQFMEVLNLKDSVEKDSFFRKLTNLSEQLPQEIVLKKLLPMLAAALEFGSASSAALGPLLKMGSWLSQEELISKVLPTAVKLFASSDRAIRVGLLQNIEQLGPALSNQIVDEQIFSHIATGFSDSSAFLRELTLKSMLILAPKLSQRTLTTSLLKYLNKLQVDEEPAIRTNTTILLGNIAKHLNESTRKRVLINAFSRALRDGFSPAKSAGIMAFSATSEYYDVIEIATRILPSLVVLTVDADSDVRTKAFQATDAFLQLVQQYHSKLENGESISSATTATTNSGSLLGWAVSSITHKNKGMDIAATVPMSIHPAQAAVATISPSTPDQQAISASSSQLDIPPLETSSDGWGDAEDISLPEEWDDVGGIEKAESVDPLSRLQAAQQRPIVSVKSVANGPKGFQTGNVESNKVEQTVENWGNDDDPWAEIAAPPPPTKAKPLSSATNKVGGAPRARQAQHISLGQHVSLDNVLGSSGTGRGRGKAAPMKLGAQRVQRTSDF